MVCGGSGIVKGNLTKWQYHVTRRCASGAIANLHFKIYYENAFDKAMESMEKEVNIFAGKSNCWKTIDKKNSQNNYIDGFTAI